MGNAPELIVMLTHNDLTVHNAYDIFDQCRNSRAKFWGFKEEPLPLEQMKKLFRYMKETGFIDTKQYIKSTGIRTCSAMAPNWLRKRMFKRVLRKK